MLPSGYSQTTCYITIKKSLCNVTCKWPFGITLLCTISYSPYHFFIVSWTKFYIYFFQLICYSSFLKETFYQSSKFCSTEFLKTIVYILGAHSNLAKTCGNGSDSDLSNVSGISGASAKTYITEESSLVLECSEKVGQSTVLK